MEMDDIKDVKTLYKMYEATDLSAKILRCKSI